MMKNEQSCRQLAEKIRKLFDDGAECSRDAWHFIQSTVSDVSLEGLSALLNNDEENEAETVMELIFFPEMHHQVALESILEESRFSPGDEAAVLACLVHPSMAVRFVLPDDMGAVEFTPPEWALEQFLARLRIAVRTDERLVDAVEQQPDPLLQTRMKVMLRNARFDPDEKKIRFLSNFLKQTDAGSDFLLEILAFLLEFLENLPDDRPIYAALTERKKSCFKALGQAGKIAEQLEKNNMETLLVQGFRMPHIDVEKTRNIMTMIDHVCYTVFGRTEILEPVQEVFEGSQQTADISDIMRRFTE